METSSGFSKWGKFAERDPKDFKFKQNFDRRNF